MRIFLIKRRPNGRINDQWLITISKKLVEQLRWEHRDDLQAEVVGEELRLTKRGPRDILRDNVPGGRYDPFTGERRIWVSSDGTHAGSGRYQGVPEDR